MSIPNVPSLFNKIAKGAEGGLQFARIMNILFIADSLDNGYKVISSSDASGDYKGVDCILEGRHNKKANFIGVQYKFFPSPLSKAHKQGIRSSLIKAITAFPEMTSWWLITPDEFTKTDMEWFAQMQQEYEIDVLPPFRFMKFSLLHHGRDFITLLMLQHPEIGKHYYDEELFKNERNKLALSKIHINAKETGWMMFDATLIRRIPNKASGKLIFDFHFLNNTDRIYLLYNIDVITEEIWTEIKGIAKKETLRSVGTLKCNMDFSKPVNSIVLANAPLVFHPKSPMRFKVYLRKFSTNCPGNMAKISFKFVFDGETLQTDVYTLSL